MRFYWSVVIVLLGTLFVAQTQLQAILRPKVEAYEKLKAYMVLSVDSEEFAAVKSGQNDDGSNVVSAPTGSLRTIYKGKISIEIGRHLQYKAKDGFNIAIFANLDKNDPAKKISVKVRISREKNRVEQLVLQATQILPYKVVRTTRGKAIYRLSQAFKGLKKNKFGQVRCRLKLLAKDQNTSHKRKGRKKTKKRSKKQYILDEI